MASGANAQRSMVTRGVAMNLDAGLSTAEQLALIDSQIEALTEGKHDDLVKQSAELRILEHQKKEDALHRKKDRLEEADILYAADKKQAYAEFQKAKQELYENMMRELHNKKRCIEEATEGSDDGPVPKRQKNWIKNFQLSETEAKADLAAIDKDFVAWPRSAPLVKAEPGVLFYHGDLLTILVPVVATNKDRTVAVRGVLSSITAKEVHIRRTDGLEIRVLMRHLRSGNWTIQVEKLAQPAAIGEMVDGDQGNVPQGMDVEADPSQDQADAAVAGASASAVVDNQGNGATPAQPDSSQTTAPNSLGVGSFAAPKDVEQQPTREAVTAF